MDIWLTKQMNGMLAPLDDYAREKLRKVKVGAQVLADVRQPRNGPHHRKFWALVTTVWQATGDWGSPEELMDDLKIELGLCKERVCKRTGEVYKRPGSISYAEMDQLKFEEFYERALGVLCEMAGGIEHAALRAAVLDQLAA